VIPTETTRSCDQVTLSIHEKGCGDGVSVGQNHAGKPSRMAKRKALP
jgi:hypothetical protein